MNPLSSLFVIGMALLFGGIGFWLGTLRAKIALKHAPHIVEVITKVMSLDDMREQAQALIDGNEKLKEHAILPDSDLGKEIGFTSDRFVGFLILDEGYLYFTNTIALVPNAEKELVMSAISNSYGVKVVNPDANMMRFLKDHLFQVEDVRDDKEFMVYKVWSMKPRGAPR